MPEQPDEDRDLSFEEVHRKYERKIFALILRLTSNREDTEDLTVETFVDAYRAWDRFRGDARISTWLHQIAVNKCKNRFRQNDRRGVTPVDDELDRQLTALERDLRLRPKEDYNETEWRAQVQAAIAALPPEYRTVLEVCENEDKSYEEIAHILNLTVPAVKRRLHRARAMVRRLLNPGPLN